MDFFKYMNDKLYCENVSINDLVEQYGTPLYVYSKNAIINKFRKYDEAFKSVSHTICYALKANSNLHLLKLLANLGSGADIVSGGELFLAMKAGIKPEKIVYASVGKTDKEIWAAMDSGIKAFNIESWQELEVINEIAIGMHRRAPIAIRLNPDIDIHGHPYISTGKSINKFGINIEQAIDVFLKAARMKGVRIDGIHCHIGSQIVNLDYFAAAAEKMAAFVQELEKHGIQVNHIDIGGGLGASYENFLITEGQETSRTPEPEQLAERVLGILSPLDKEIFFEPGRSIIGEAGALISEVLFRKESNGKKYVIVDAGMNDLIRPSLYNAYHQIVPSEKKKSSNEVVDIVGPICETGDFLAKDRELPHLDRGDFIAVMTAGAYGYSLSSNYNSRPRAAEVWIDDDRHQLIRARERYEDFLS
ncbi:diaminopimelate decarboxylase [candidate division KSB1 bacterium]|nr:diaminopimelate decarboxylase [candidate division KSB1 bacterium]